MKRINFSWLLLVAIAGLVGSSIALAEMTAKEKQTARADIQKMTNETLQRLYKAQPGTKKAIDSAAGYAMFSNFGMKIFVAGSGKGSGMAVDKKSGKIT